MVITEKAIEKIIRERAEARLAAECVFGFSQIPLKELKKQYYYLADALALKGYGGKFMLGKNDKLLFEESQATLSPEETKEQLMKRFNFEEWQIRIHTEANNIQLMTLCPDFRENCQLIKDAMSACGWSFALQRKITDDNGYDWLIMSFDPMYQDNISNEIRKYRFLYHWTPMVNYESIKSKGLEPRSENSWLQYPPKVHLLKGYLTTEEMIVFGQDLYNQNKSPKNDGKYILLMIDVLKLPQDLEFFYDPRFERGYYTKNTIPPNAIYPWFGYDFIKNEMILN